METLVRRRDDRAVTWFSMGEVTTAATLRETGGAYGLAEHVVTSASNPPMHIHTDEEEAFYVLEGKVELEVDGAVSVADAGTFALVPRGAVHTFRVLTPEARLLVLSSGAPEPRFEAFVAETGGDVPVPPDPQVLTEAAARHGIVILPPPE